MNNNFNNGAANNNNNSNNGGFIMAQGTLTTMEAFAGTVKTAMEAHYGVDYKVVEPGLYNVAFKVNGKSYEAEEVEYFKASSDNWYSFEVKNESLYFGITDMNAVSHLAESDYEDGSSICLWSNGFVIESFELTKFEKVN